VIRHFSANLLEIMGEFVYNMISKELVYIVVIAVLVGTAVVFMKIKI